MMTIEESIFTIVRLMMIVLVLHTLAGCVLDRLEVVRQACRFQEQHQTPDSPQQVELHFDEMRQQLFRKGSKDVVHTPCSVEQQVEQSYVEQSYKALLVRHTQHDSVELTSVYHTVVAKPTQEDTMCEQHSGSCPCPCQSCQFLKQLLVAQGEQIVDKQWNVVKAKAD